MGIKGFAKKIYIEELRENKVFIGIIAVVIMVIYNAMNIYYNDAIYGVSTGTIVQSYTTMNNMVRMVNKSVTSFIKENILIMIIIAIITIGLVFFEYIKSKSNSILSVVYAGGTQRDSLKFLTYISIKSFLIATLIGISVGIIISPICTGILYWIIGYKGTIFIFSVEGLIDLVLLMIIVYGIESIISMGYIYRKDVMESSYKFIENKKIMKIPYGIYIIIYLTPLAVALTLPIEKETKELIYIVSCISLLSLNWIIKFGLDEMFNFFRKRKFMYKNCRIIYWKNAIASIKGLVVYVGLWVIGIIYTINIIGETIEYSAIKDILIVCIVGISIIISGGMGYKLVINYKDVQVRVKILKKLEFSEEKIVSCVKKEFSRVFFIITMISMGIVLGSLIVYVSANILSLTYGIAIIIAVIMPVKLVGFIFSSWIVRKIKEDFKNEREKYYW